LITARVAAPGFFQTQAVGSGNLSFRLPPSSVRIPKHFLGPILTEQARVLFNFVRKRLQIGGSVLRSEVQASPRRSRQFLLLDKPNDQCETNSIEMIEIAPRETARNS
jgi:hypothetical protein